MAAIEPKVKERFAELVGLGCTLHEASSAMGFSDASGDTIISQPEYRKIADDVKRRRGLRDQSSEFIAESFQATYTDDKGTVRPDVDRRQWATEQLGKPGNKDILDEGAKSDLLPNGVMQVYPVPPEARPLEEDRTHEDVGSDTRDVEIDEQTFLELSPDEQARYDPLSGYRLRREE